MRLIINNIIKQESITLNGTGVRQFLRLAPPTPPAKFSCESKQFDGP